MLRTIGVLAVVCAAVVLSDFCKTTNGHWTSGLVDGANDFYTTGVTPNDNYFCWEACLNTAMVRLASGAAKQLNRRLRKIEDYKNSRYAPGSKLDDDPNAQFCADPQLRADINTALQKVTNHSAKAIARTLQYQIARPGWVYNVVELGSGLTADGGLWTDYNFCLYTTFLNPELYDIRLAAIDMS